MKASAVEESVDSEADQKNNQFSAEESVDSEAE